MRHYWQGEWVSDDEAGRRLDTLEDRTQQVITGPRLSPLVVMAAAERLIPQLDDEALKFALSRSELERKVTREFGGVDPARLVRFDFRRPVYEAWVPLGLLAHVTAGNAAVVGVLSAIEGLLSGNLNVIKVSRHDNGFTADVLARLADSDPTGQIAQRLVVLHFSSANKDWLERMCGAADAVAVWGGEEAVAGVAELVRPGTRLVDWGPKLSFAYLTADEWSSPDTLGAIARDIVTNEQQACSSPQVIYLDTEHDADVFSFASRFATVLGAETAPADEPSQAEWAEINNTVQVTRLEEHLGLTRVHSDESGAAHWRVLADTRSALRASPLYRTVWVKPLPRKQIAATLRPMRRYLQTVGLAASRQDTAVLARAFVSVGAQRITVPGEMQGGYSGEPHDGVYALQRYSNRVAVRLDDRFALDASLDDLDEVHQLPAPRVPVTGKESFSSLQSGAGDVFFRSGGSSGAPKLSAFTWADYDEHMRFGAEALLATGLDPARDRVMNLFFGGHMYGSFVSFFSSLERMGAVQFPMGGEWHQLEHIARSIVDNRVDTLLTAPSFVQRLFTEQGDLLRSYGGVRKIFYAAEHFAERQVRWLRDEFGVEVVRSAAYGSVDAGPMGYACPHSPDRVHHLFTGLHTLEILDENDLPVRGTQPGRLVFTAHTRRGQRLDRYEIGDLGRWVLGHCPCGRRTPRFELLGRVGDVFRTGGQTMNFRRFVNAAEDGFGYAGALQVVLSEHIEAEQLTVLLEEGKVADLAAAERALLTYSELAEGVLHDRLIRLRVEAVPLDSFARTTASGKLISVVDRRGRAV